MARQRGYQVGDPVVYRKPKRSPSPGPRAERVRPETMGESYHYIVEKHWTVIETREDQVVVQTRRGKVHVIDRDDPRLRPARWWERLLLKHRFPEPNPELADRADASSTS
jgi:hypothetical protein